MIQQDLLFELGCEELPPKTLLTLRDALLNNILADLKAAGFGYGDYKAYATPRRLAVIIQRVDFAQADKIEEKRGPSVQAAFSETGEPSRAALGFAKSCGVEFTDLERLVTKKGEWLAYKKALKGKMLAELIPNILNQSILKLPIAKRMRWGDGSTEFVRPVHWSVLMYGEQIIETEILGLKTGGQSYGHRFHAPDAINIESPARYVEILKEKGCVEVDFESRKKNIRDAALKIAEKVGGTAHIDAALLDEVTALNEQPIVVMGHFDPRFLKLPKEVLITTMQSNQKYFPVINKEGVLLAHFITFSNIDSHHPESVQKGNERVILPRLADAEFFWNQDLKQPLSTRVDPLSAVVFQQKLGSMADKTERLQTLSTYIAHELQADEALAQRAALLAKTDLMTNMVSEFASLQGIMGRYYALADNELVEVAHALEEQYFPKQAGSITPKSTTGQILSLADKLDTLTGIFSAGFIPTGDKDPYGLRRASLGILRILIENKLPLNVVELIETALKQYSHEFDLEKTKQQIIQFVFERLKGYCLEKGFKIDTFEAVMALKPSQPLDFMSRIHAVKEFRGLPESQSLAAANKRIANILRKSATKPAESISNLVETDEKQLLILAEKSAMTIKPLLEKSDYTAALLALAQLKAPIDCFFDHVMVNCDDVGLRASRLALLNLLFQQFLQIADISKLQVAN
ncbi:MAG: glycine--tRNA ligase subunit beta [Methylococcales bacterium]|nr:glycine--tRNA ligase subunit beta [Methylococcales bacterium]